jgi:glucokinase
MSKKIYLGFDIGGTKIAVCVGDSDGQVLASDRLDGGTMQAYTEVLPRLLEMGDRLIAEAGLNLADIKACGISAPGPLDPDRGMLEKSPNMIWDEVPIRDDIAAHFKLPTTLENDGNAGALAEWYFGAAKGARNAIYFTMSTGIGGGIIAENRLVRGTCGNAGELGHAILDINGPACGCGMRGCFEAFCSGRNVQKRLRAMVGNDSSHPLMQLPEVGGDIEKLNFQALRAGVQRGIPVAQELWDDICLRMAQGLGLYMMVFNPEIIVLGTLFHYSGDLLLKPVEHYLPRFTWPKMHDACKLVLPGLGSKVGELSGIAVAIYFETGG